MAAELAVLAARLTRSGRAVDLPGVLDRLHRHRERIGHVLAAGDGQ